ncbi:7 8-dihydropterin-6-methyl-4-(beta-D-ribofuranosyl) aminobenzene-5 phosphate synthase [Fusarium tjaetaba]|uniref:7 8-dihydropterin-6-methyl-4-(Beta-D-ribofuranosyl) aminobenzene-5 phosphate synthase n=1 Tax=Fusarium tjaetaba TaxID=1567544 RepID=A0A8H5VED2_9HYPO|nr:7 8-dihydropterin-6-methyl-4-(beta-D-ribofuranosyl) aminobenzene-5 phosphate synthase [Fusarium tjaetaba]KAF5618079.1 7 8-dihydropterin-6-methyl-4-(beta-D-ribofuranosyl) aminobenzene-5 phosphate synthase [Fusarium tjaetaba]
MTTKLIEVDSLDIHVLINDEIDQISPSPNPQVQHAQSFAGVPLSHVSDPNSRGGARLEMPMRNICCGAHAKKDDKSHTLLFDAGPEEDVFEKNVQRLKLPMTEIGAIVLSHWHRDHSGGLPSAIRLASKGRPDGDQVVVALPPDKPAFRGIMFDQPISLEADPTTDEINSAGGKTVILDEAQTILGDAFLISGEIPRQTDYEGGIPGGVRYDPAKDEWIKDELIMEERFVMYKGLVIFTGCSHAGLINIARHARTIDDIPIYAIVGGYHLADASPEKMEQSMKDLKDLEPVLLMPGHCTGWRFKGLIEKEMPRHMAPIFGGTKYTL